MDSFRVTKRELRALEAFICKDSLRSALSCLHFFDDGRLAATDGHSLLIRDPLRAGSRLAEVKKDPPERKPLFAVSRRLVGRLVRAMDGKCCAEIGPLVDEKLVEFSIGVLGGVWKDDFEVEMKGRMAAISEGATPPHFDEVIPKLGEQRAAPRVGLAVHLLKRLDLVRIAADSTHKGLTMYPPLNELDPVMFKAVSRVSESEWTALLMPLRI